MSELSDHELEAQLKRRRSAPPLDHMQRVELTEAIHSRVAKERRSGNHRWLRWGLVPGVAAMLSVVLLIAVNLPRAPEAPSSSASPAGTAESPVVTATPSTGPQAMRILSTSELVEMWGQAHLGQVVVAEARIDQPAGYPACLSRIPPLTSCALGQLASSGPPIPIEGDRDLRLNLTPYLAFRFGGQALVYLGSVMFEDEHAWSVEGLVGTDASKIYPVDGWLVSTGAISCPGRSDQDPEEDASYSCGASWVTSTAQYTVTASSSAGVRVTMTLDGLHVQAEAYDDFAPLPRTGDYGPEPRHGIYLVRPNGCPALAEGDCPAWEMVGRLDPPMTATPTPKPSSTPTSTPSPESGVVMGADGIPTLIDGQPVFVGSAIEERVAQATDDTPFLVGGYLFWIHSDCDAPPPDLPDTPLLDWCPYGFVLEPQPRSGPQVSILVEDRGFDAGLWPTVLRVHVHDERSADCPRKYRADCESAIVAEAQVWAGQPAPSLFCTRVDTESCLAVVQAVRDQAERLLTEGGALVVEYACLPDASCPAPIDYIVVEVHPGWRYGQDVALRAFRVAVEPGSSELRVGRYFGQVPQYVNNQVPNVWPPWPPTETQSP